MSRRMLGDMASSASRGSNDATMVWSAMDRPIATPSANTLGTGARRRDRADERGAPVASDSGTGTGATVQSRIGPCPTVSGREPHARNRAGTHSPVGRIRPERDDLRGANP